MRGLLLCFLAATLGSSQEVAKPDAAADHTWRYAQSASVRLLIRSEPPVSAPRKLTCTVTGPGASPSSEITSTIEAEFRGSQFTRYYPHDFGRRVFPGRYNWACRVEQGVDASGAFVIRDDGIIELPARE